MLSRLLLFLAAWVTSNAQLPGFPHGGGSCETDWDCSLGGECTDSVCACDTWWTGETCSYLNLQPPVSLESQGLQVPGYYSWGGHPIQEDNETDIYHLFVSLMCDHATLGSWTSKSSMAHATATIPEGPYTFAPGLDQQLVVPPWSHGAEIVRDPPTGKYLLWHLGDGTIPASSWAPCYNSSESEVPAAGSEVASSGSASSYRSQLEPGQKQAFIEVADSVYGPWSHFNNNSGVSVSYPNGSWCSSIDNPFPYIFENGTTLLYFRSETCPEGWGALAPACLGVARADTWEGPYESLFVDPITHPEGEDPFVFQDPRGYFHLLSNVNTYHARCAQGVPCGGHAWSLDGLTWSNQSIGAFGPVIRFTNGTYFTGAYVERPQIYQDPVTKVPIAFFTGFGRTSYMDSANYAQLFCAEGMNVTADCGPTLAPPPPPPVPITVKQGDLCLISNSSGFPCAGGWGNSCPIALGSCSDPTATWNFKNISAGGHTLSNLAPEYTSVGNALNIDCNNCVAGTIAKVCTILSYGNGLTFDNGLLRVDICAGMCLSGTSAVKHQGPCKTGEFTEASQVVLVDCTDPAATGWSWQGA